MSSAIPQSPLRRTLAFSLVELLVVIGLITLIVSISIPAFGNFARSAGLSSSANKIMDHLNLARQTALAKNQPVEIRIYHVPDNQTTSPLYYQAFRLLQIGSTSTNDLVKIQYLDSNVKINETASFSSLIGEAGKDGTNSPTLLSGPLPGKPTEYEYVAFQFRPNGSMDLPNDETKSWFLTLHAKNARADGAVPGLPKNFITIQLDPVTGRAKILRP